MYSRYRFAATIAMSALGFLVSQPGFTQDRPPPQDILNLEVTVDVQVAPEVAAMTLAVVREGTDPSLMTHEIDQVLAHAIAQARATPGIEVASGGYSTTPRFDNKGNRTGWQVRATLILKSKDIGGLGTLAGKLSSMPNGLQIASASFEISPEQKANEESVLIAHGVTAFKARALETAKAFGYASYGVREITLGEAEESGMPRPIAMRAMNMTNAPATEHSPVPLENGRVTLALTLHGSVQMRH